MFVERNDNEVVIRLSGNVDTQALQDFLDFARYKEITAKYKTPQGVVDKLAEEINKNWWAKNKKKYGK